MSIFTQCKYNKSIRVIIKKLKLTDMGLVDVDNFRFTEVLFGQPPADTEPCGACR